MTVIVRIFVAAFIGPTERCGASGFLVMKDVWFARPLYVPSGAPPCVPEFRADEPKSFLTDRASAAFSSYQLLCLVASLAEVMGMLRFAVYAEAVSSFSDEPRLAAAFDDAVTTAFFLRRFTRWPDSSSDDE